MRSSGLRLAVASILFALCASFKDQEFKKCGDAGFCRRNLRKTGPEFSITSAEVVGSSIVAVLQNDGAAVSMDLKLVAFEDRFVRLIVDEHVDVGRYKISDLIQEPVQGREAAWEVLDQSAASLSVKIDQMVATLNFKPFQLLVKIAGQDAVTLNSRNMFNFEHRRQKAEGDDGSACDGCWEETFRSSTDSKKNGPEAISLDLGFPGFDHVYGIPERATSMALKPTVGGEPYRMYNLDVFEYLVDHYFGLYGSIPFMLAHKKGLTTGVLWLNAAEMFIDVEKVSGGTATQWVSEAGIIDLFIFSGPTPADVVKQYAVLTGTTALPQLFAIGYHQCRWNYKDEADAFAVDAGFDEHAIPYDVLWLDIEHTNGKRYLTWDSQHFPNPQDMQNDIGSRGREMVTIVDPHVKRDQGYYIFKEATDAGFFVQNSAGGVFDGWCWPGSSSYLDVNSPEVRNWWAQQFTLDKYQGSTKHLYIWNDMNEPSVFNGPEVTFPKDNIHAGGVEHREVHNLYGLYYHMATADGLKVRGDTLDPEGDRPFVLSRAFFTGTQRVGPIWTGDNAADWDHLRISIPMLLTLGVTGLPFSGADVGGFFGNPTPELLTRWYQVGIYYPFFRGHAHLDTARREPWLFGEETTDRLREAIRTRYALLPYMYTLFRHANTTGVPVMRPLFYEFPEEEATFAIEEEFMLGPGLLVKPVIAQDVTQVPVYLPSGSWYSSKTGTPVSSTGKVSFKVNMDSIPSFYRGGHIIPRRERPRRSTAAMANDPFTLVVALDDKLKASGDLYLDDGRTFAFKKGHFLHREFSFDNLALSSARGADVMDSADGSTQKGAMGSNLTIERIVFLGLKSSTKYTAVLPGGQKVTVEPGPLNMLFPSTDAHVLARPNLPVAADWTIQLKEH